MFDQFLFILFDEAGLTQFPLGLPKYECLQKGEEQALTDTSPGLSLPRSVGAAVSLLVFGTKP